MKYPLNLDSQHPTTSLHPQCAPSSNQHAATQWNIRPRELIAKSVPGWPFRFFPVLNCHFITHLLAPSQLIYPSPSHSGTSWVMGHSVGTFLLLSSLSPRGKQAVVAQQHMPPAPSPRVCNMALVPLSEGLIAMNSHHVSPSQTGSGRRGKPHNKHQTQKNCEQK